MLGVKVVRGHTTSAAPEVAPRSPRHGSGMFQGRAVPGARCHARQRIPPLPGPAHFAIQIAND